MIINKVNEKVITNKVIWARNDSKLRSNMILNLKNNRINVLEKISTRNFRE